MARITFKGLEEYEKKLSLLAKDTEQICGAAIYEGASIVADEIKAGIRSLPRKTGVTQKGLEEGFGISKLREDNGFYNVKLGFDGYNANGEPNVMMARIMESGTSKVPKHPFVRPAVNRAKAAAQDKMAAVLDEQIEKRMK